MPVVILNLICVIGLAPLLFLSVYYFDTIGAACVWAIYGLFYYLGCQIIGLRGLPNTTVLSSVLENFIIPFLVAFSVAAISAYWLSEIKSNLLFVLLFLTSLSIGWFAAFLSCKDLREIVLKKWIWST